MQGFMSILLGDRHVTGAELENVGYHCPLELFLTSTLGKPDFVRATIHSTHLRPGKSDDCVSCLS